MNVSEQLKIQEALIKKLEKQVEIYKLRTDLLETTVSLMNTVLSELIKDDEKIETIPD